jgi:hypothetical protein
MLLGDEEKLDAELLPAHAPHDLLRELVPLVKLDQGGIGQLAAAELGDRLECEVKRLEIQTDCHLLSSIRISHWEAIHAGSSHGYLLLTRE